MASVRDRDLPRRRLGRPGLALACAALIAVAACKKDPGGSGGGHDFGLNDPGLVAAIGDSITAGYGGVRPWPEYLAEIAGKSVLNFGRPYDASAAGAAKVGDVLADHRPGYLAVLYGTNDVLGGVPLHRAVENLRATVRAALAVRSVPVLGLVTPLRGPEAARDAGVRELNALLRAMAAEEGVAVVDLYSLFSPRPEYTRDGVHPTDAGSRAIAQAFAAAILE